MVLDFVVVFTVKPPCPLKSTLNLPLWPFACCGCNVWRVITQFSPKVLPNPPSGLFLNLLHIKNNRAGRGGCGKSYLRGKKKAHSILFPVGLMVVSPHTGSSIWAHCRGRQMFVDYCSK